MFLPIINVLFHTILFIFVNAEIAILGEGVGYIEEDDIALIFYITVKNVCKDELELSINMLQCCEVLSQDEVDCDSMTLIGGDMGRLPSMYVKNLTLIYPNLYLFNRRGVCSIEVTYRNQLKKKEMSIDVHFDTTKSCPGKQHKNECETVDLDIKQNCNPVDCLIKYSGTNSYFNPQCKRCQKVPVCNSKTDGCFPDIAYSPYNNECIDLNIPISKKDLESIENGPTNTNQTTMINAICHYGTVTESGECICHDGWTTATNDEGMYEPGVAQHHLCNIQIGDWNCVNKTRIRVTAILIAIFALTIISKVLLLMCVMTWCYRHFRKPEKTCARELDPDDQSIVLCEDINSYDKCLCCELEEKPSNKKEQKPRALQSQTVNVSYFPCSPSVFSSIKTSTGSTKYSSKTDPTIDLSISSSSAAISFPEDESSEESDNTNNTLFCEDGLSNDLAYGVYCEVDEEDKEEIDEEAEQEEEEVEEEEEEDESTNDNKS